MPLNDAHFGGCFVFAARSFIRPQLTCPVSDESTLATDLD